MCVRRTTCLGTAVRVSDPRPGSLLLLGCWLLLWVLLLRGSGVRATDHVPSYGCACVRSTSWLLASAWLLAVAVGAGASGVRCACDGPRAFVRLCVCPIHVLAPCFCLAAGCCCGRCCFGGQVCVRRTTCLRTAVRVSDPRPGSLLLLGCWLLLWVLLLRGSGVRATDHVPSYGCACVRSTSCLLASAWLLASVTLQGVICIAWMLFWE